MSYLEFYKKDVLDCTSVIKGSCYSMCPQEEIKMRENEKLVHVLEVVGSTRKLVKCYSRSAADSVVAIPRLLRPYSVLMNTVHYLLLEVTKRTDVPTSMVYDFVNDRLRAVRQDMTIQRLPPEECVLLLEPMVRFYVYYGWKLSDYSIKDYDPVLNKKYLLECIKWFLCCYDALDKTQNGEKICELTVFFSNLNIDKKLTCDRILMESLYILCNLDDMHPLFRYLNLQKHFKSAPTLRLSYKIAVANMKGNFIKVCKLLDKLCPLTYCALCLYLPVLQRQSLKMMSYAYNSKHLSIPSSVLCEWLCFNSAADLRKVCTHYGLRVEGDAVKFIKGEFKTDAPVLQLKKLFLRDEKLDLKIPNVFVYNIDKD